jgi:hypothetical protein
MKRVKMEIDNSDHLLDIGFISGALLLRRSNSKKLNQRQATLQSAFAI